MPRINTTSRCLFAIIFCYLMSGQALGSRDPLGTSIDWHIFTQLALFAGSFVAASILWARNRVFTMPSRAFWLFLIFGLFAVVSSIRSFWPPLSVVQGCLFCAVLILAELLCNTFSSTAVLRATYYGIVMVFVVAILVGIAMPGSYPLILSDMSGRQRLTLFTYHFGDYAYMSGLGVFVGRLPAVGARWYFQLFLGALTITSGSRACTCALIVIWLAIQLRRVKDIRLLLGIGAAAAAALSLILLLQTGGASDLGPSVYRTLKPFYGADVLAQSPFELSGRVELWVAATAIFRKSVFLGFGFNGARDQLLRLVPWSGGSHNAFLELLLTAGCAGLISFLAAWISAMRTSFKSRAGRSTLAIHCFLLLVAGTGPSFTIFQYFGVFLIICMHYWTCSLTIGGSKRGAL